MKKSSFVGVDGGASKTHALIANEKGEIIGFGTSGGCNHQKMGYENAAKEIAKAVKNAIESSNQPLNDIQLGCFCLAGADFPEDFNKLAESIAFHSLTQKMIIRNDTFAALRAGLSRSYGVTVISGTGFNAAGIGINGNEYSLPGLGELSGDWGGGQDISLAMIQAVIRQWDGRGKNTLLTKLVLNELKLNSVELLLGKLYKGEIDRLKLIPLVPLLFSAAVQGDPVAEGIVIRTAEEVGISARAVARHLNFGSDPFEVVLAGSIFKGEGPLLINTIEKIIHNEFELAEITVPAYEPVVGALMLCFDEIFGKVRKNEIQNLLKTLPEKLIINDN